MLYMVTFTINIPQMLAYIPYMDPMGCVLFQTLRRRFILRSVPQVAAERAPVSLTRASACLGAKWHSGWTPLESWLSQCWLILVAKYHPMPYHPKSSRI